MCDIHTKKIETVPVREEKSVAVHTTKAMFEIKKTKFVASNQIMKKLRVTLAQN